MSTVITSVEDVCNLALSILGYPQRIGDIYEGSKPSKLALDLYGQTRDEVLRSSYWGFARRETMLALVKGAPPPGQPWNATEYAQVPWQFEYEYPTDCIRLLYVMPSIVNFPVYDPQPQLFEVGNDPNINPPMKVIFTNLSQPVAVYTGQVTDMSLWEPLFTSTLASALAGKFAAALSEGKSVVETRKALEQETVQIGSLASQQEEM